MLENKELELLGSTVKIKDKITGAYELIRYSSEEEAKQSYIISLLNQLQQSFTNRTVYHCQVFKGKNKITHSGWIR